MSEEATPRIFIPYNNAYELDQYFESTGEGSFDKEDFYTVVSTFEASGSDKNQKHTLELFKNLGKLEALRRSHIVARLSKLLERINTRKNDLSSTSSAQT